LHITLQWGFMSLILSLAACSDKAENGTAEIAGEGELAELDSLDLSSEPDIELIGQAAEDPAVPPVFQAEYTQGEIAGCVTLGTYTYSWTYEGENGEIDAESDGDHPLDDPEIVTCQVEDGTEVTFSYSEKVSVYMVYMWREGADVDDCQVLSPANDRITVEKNAVYMVSAVYENGSIVDYAFKTL